MAQRLLDHMKGSAIGYGVGGVGVAENMWTGYVLYSRTFRRSFHDPENL